MLTIGLIHYINTIPFQHGLAERMAGADVKFIHGVPSELNRALAAGEVDVAPISSIAAARMADSVAILPGLSIASLGAVKTVLLLSWSADPRELGRQPIALTDEAATSVALLKLLCRERYLIEPEFRIAPQNAAAMLRANQAALVIGDTALIEASQHRMLVDSKGKTRRPFIIDLGDEWLKHTNLPFVFALWAVRREAVPEVIESNLPAALLASKDSGLAAIDALATEYAPQLDLPVGLIARYLRDLRYDLTEWDRSGLKHFLDSTLGEERRPLDFLPMPGSSASRAPTATPLVARP